CPLRRLSALSFSTLSSQPSRSTTPWRSERLLQPVIQSALRSHLSSHPQHVAASSGSGAADLEKLCSILEAIPLIQYICLDVANGYSEHFVEFVKRVPSYKKYSFILGEMCAVIECADSAHGLKAFFILFFVLPEADFVMLGGMSAGHDQCAGEIIEKDSKKFKLFYEMSSDTAMKKYVGGVAEYRASEGRTVQVPYKGDVENTIRDIFGGLRSTCTYVGAAKLKELSRRTTFIRVTQQSSQMFT
uniref:GMP reductase n=1 Tax=Cyprinus carpio TaxID=7962 RepID=A0A8C2EU25_CYPCA